MAIFKFSDLVTSKSEHLANLIKSCSLAEKKCLKRQEEIPVEKEFTT